MNNAQRLEVPQGWAPARIIDVVLPRTGKADPQAAPSARFIGMEQVEAHTMRLLGTVPASSMRSAANTFQAGDVLYGRLRAYLNKVYQPDFDGLCSGEFIVLPESRALLGRYLKYLLNSGDFVRFASQLNTGDRPRVDWDQIKSYKFALPPIREQERLADTLDEVLSDLDAGVAALERVLAKLKHYRAAVLKAAVEGTLTEEWRHEHPEAGSADALLTQILAERRRRWEDAQDAKFKAAGKQPPKDWRDRYPAAVKPAVSGLAELPQGWCWTSLDQLSNFITSGSRGWGDFYALEGPLFVRSQDIRTDQLVLDDVAHVTLPSSSEGARTRLSRGDLLVTITGANVARAALVDLELEEAYVSQHVGMAHFVEPAIGQFVHAYVIAPSGGRQVLLKLAYGAGKPGLNLDNLRELPIPLPPLDEQTEVVEVISEQLSVIAHIEHDINTRLMSTRALRHSILRHAFTGQLLPQDPNDEPAAELLKRIAVEREELARLARVAKQAKPDTRMPRARARKQ